MCVKSIIIIGPSFKSRGGISAVVNAYRYAGLFDRWPIKYIATHTDGTLLTKVSLLLKALFEFIKVLKLGDISLVHIHTSSRRSFWRKSLFCFLCFLCRVPVLLHIHNSHIMRFYSYESSTIQKRIIKYIFANVTCIIVLSNQLLKYISELDINTNVHIVYNPSDVDLGPWDRSSEIPKTIVFLGLICKAKGIFDLVSAVRLLVDKHKTVKLFCAGTGSLDELKAYVKTLGLGHVVRILGWIGRDEKFTLLREASIFALPSYDEGLPMSLLEAMGMGMAVIVAPVGGVPDAIEHGVHGLFITPGDIESISNALNTLIENPKLRAELGRNAIYRVRTHFSRENIVKKIEDIYNDIIGSSCA